MRHGDRGGHGVIEWLGGPERPWLHFAHATGMCAELYADLLDPLAATFNIVASDARGHGRSTLPADPAALVSWRTYQDDLAALLALYPGRDWRLAGHSMGASVGLELAVRMPGLAAAVVLVEPACVPFDGGPAWAAARAAGTPFDNPMAAQAVRRRSQFASRDEARDNWRGRGVFRGWRDRDLDAYVAGGMRDTDTGAELACTPAWESATFNAVTAALGAAVAAWHGPLTLLHGTAFSTVTQADADTIAKTGATGQRNDGPSHFLPLSHTDLPRPPIPAPTS